MSAIISEAGLDNLSYEPKNILITGGAGFM
jgi:hypothetical protein